MLLTVGRLDQSQAEKLLLRLKLENENNNH